MLKIRFNRIGRRNRVYYRIVVQEHTAAPGGRHVAVIGSHDPHAKKTIIDRAAAQHWLSVGAQPSDTVHNLFVREGIIKGKKRPKGVPYTPPKEEAAPEEEKTEEEKTEEEAEEKAANDERAAEEKAAA